MEFKIIENHPNDSRVKYKEDGVFQTLSSRMGTGGGNVPMVHTIAGNIIGRDDKNGGNQLGIGHDVSPTLNTVDRHAVADERLASGKTTSGCINASCGKKQFLNNQEAFSGDYHIVTPKTVRRLTPTECERLQGLPDGYTDIEFNGKPAPDSRRYKALGNGMAQPVADFVIRRIAEVVSNGV